MDAEVKAMADVVAALKPLDEETVARVVKWAAQRYGISLKAGAGRAPSGAGAEGDEEETAFKSFHELFDAANPNTAPDKALVAGYWFQVCEGQEDLDSQQVNKELKNLGHQSTNITRDLDALIRRTPRQVIQVRKQGSTKQARKRYKVTREGIRTVEKMLSEE